MSSADTGSQAERALAAKAAGNERIKDKDYEGAAACYSDAIRLDSSQATFYSNRAVALGKVGRYAEVIRDCNLALGVDPAFQKPLYYKASALLQLGDAAGASAVAAAALAQQGFPESLQEPLQKIANKAAAKVGAESGISAMIAKIVPLQRVLAVFLVLVYLLPLPFSFGFSAYRFASLTFLALLAFQLYAVHGIPWGMEFVRKVMDPYQRYFDYTLHRVALAALLVFAKPYALGIVSVMALELCLVLLFDLPRLLPNALAARVSSLVHTNILPRLLPEASVHNQALSVKYAALKQKVMRWTAHTEVFLGVFMLVEVLLPTRSLLQTLLIWQFLRTMAMFCGETRQAFATVDGVFRSFTTRVPALGGYYVSLSNYLATWGELPTQPQAQGQGAAASGGAGGFMQRAASSCNIM